MIASDGGTVSVTHYIDDCKVGVRQLYAGGKTQGTAVGGMNGTGINITRHAAGTSYARGNNRFFAFFAAVDERPQYGMENYAVAATGAPQVWEKLFS